MSYVPQIKLIFRVRMPTNVASRTHPIHLEVGFFVLQIKSTILTRSTLMFMSKQVLQSWSVEGSRSEEGLNWLLYDEIRHTRKPGIYLRVI